MIETTFLLPHLTLRGDYPWTADIPELRKRLNTLGGGHTVDYGAEGEWLDAQGETHRERSDRYTVGLPPERLPDWLALLAWVKETCSQQSLYATIAGQPFLL